MKFPVDLLADVSQAELEQSAHNYMNNLLYSNLDTPEQLTLSDSTTVTINIANVGVLPLYGHNDEQKILALFSPNELFKAVALYLLDQWWTMEDILKTANPARNGVVKVETLGERIVLYILNRVIYRAKEINSLEEEVPFLCHEEKDYAKIHWNNGEAVGFYSVKPTGSLCNSFTPRSYQLPVMDSIFVRKRHRGKGFGLQMLEDFVLSFEDEYLGLRYPLTKPMYKVCEKYLRQYPRGTDLLWEVEREGAPSQRTNIASKIQTMDLSAVSRNLFMEESLVITEVTENDVVMGAITTQINEAGSMECRVEIVEEVRGTKDVDDVPVAARSRSSGSKRRKTEDKSEKMIRIEDIEAETPTEEHMVQTESVLSVATEEKADDEVDNASEESAPRVTDKLTSQDLEEAEVTSAPDAEESQIEDDGTLDPNDTSCDSQIRVENVASELEGADEESREEDSAVLEVSDAQEMHKEEEALDKVEEVTQGKVSDENSEGADAGKTGRPVGKSINTVQSEAPRRKSWRFSKEEEEGVKEETAAQDGRKVLRGRTVVNSPAPKRKYQRRSQKVCEEQDKEIHGVAEKDPPTTEVVEGQEAVEIATGEKNAVAVEEIAEEENLEQETEKCKESGIEDTVVNDEDEKVTEAETSVMEEKVEDSDDEKEEPPVVQRRALRGRRKATPKPKPTRQSKRHQQEEEKHTNEAAPEEETHEQVQEHSQVEKDKPEEEIPAEVNLEEKMVQEEEKTEGVTETVTVMEEDKEEEADNMIQEPDVVTVSSETVQPDEGQDQTVAEELQENNTDSEIPLLQKATVVLVDLKTSGHHFSATEAEETAAAEECVAPENEQMELKVAERDVSTSVVEEQTLEPEKLVVEEEDTAEEETEELKEDKEKEEISNVDDTEAEEEEALVIETRVLRSRKVERETDIVQVEGDVETVEEKQAATSEVDIPVGDDAEKNLLPAQTDENSEKDEPAVTTRSLRPGRISASSRPRGRPRKHRKQVQQAEDDEAAIEKTDQEMEKKTEDEIGEEIKEKAVSEKEESLEPEAEVEEGKAVTEQAVEEKSEVVSETLADGEVQVEKCDDEGKPVEEDGEVKSPPVAETRALRSGGKTIKTPRTTRSTRSKQQDDAEEDRVDEDEPPVETKILRRGRKSVRKQLQKEDEAPKEPAAEMTQVEAGLESAEKPSTEADEVKATEENKVEEEKEESVAVEVEKGVVEEETMITIDEEEKTAGEAAAADEEGESEPPLTKPAADSALLTPCEEEAPSQEEQESEESQITALQRVTVVLVDLKKTHQEVQDETLTGEEGPQEKTAAMEEVEQKEVMEEDTVAEEDVPAEQTEQEEAVVQEEGSGENVEDAATVPNTDEGVAKETTEADENKSVDEEEEPAGIKTRTRRSGKEAVKATPRRKSSRNRKDDVQQEVEEEASGDSEEKTTVRVLRRGRKSVPVTERRSTKRTQKKQQEEEEGEESTAVEETDAKEQEEQAEEQQTMIDQEKEEEGQEEDTTPQVENTEAEMSVEKEDTVAEEAVTQDVVEDGQASSPEINDEAAAPAGESADVGETLDDVTEEEAGEKSTEEDEPTVETRVLRRGRKSAPATPRRKSKRARTQLQTAEEGEQETSPAEEIQTEETKAEETEDNQDLQTEEKDEEQKEENTEPEVEMEKVEPVAEVSLTEQETVEEERSAVAETSADEQGKTVVGESVEETPPTDETMVTNEEETPVVETKVLRSGGKTVRATTRRQNTKTQDEEAAVEESTEEDEPTVETRVLRRGRKSAPVTPRRKSKRARTQLQTEEEEEGSAPAVETEEEEEEAGQESHEEKGEKAEGEEKSAETQEEVENVTGEESTAAEAEQVNDNKEAVEETNTVENPTPEADEMNSAEEEETPVSEKSATPLEVESEPAVAEEEAAVEDASVEEDQEAPAVTTRTLRSRTKTSPALRRSGRHKDQAAAEIQGQEDENAEEEEEEEVQEVIQPTDDSLENREESNAKEQAETKETSELPASDATENKAEETAELVDERVVEPADEEPVTEEMESPEQELSESKEDSSPSRSLRRRAKTVGDKEDDKAEEIQPPKRRSIRQRPRVDYRENEEEEEGDMKVTTSEEEEDKVESNEPKDIKEAECPADELIEKESNQEENLENNTGATESTSEKGDVLNLVLDTDEEVETAGMSQEDEEDEQNMSEKEVEPVAIGKRVLRRRLGSSEIITPRSNSKRSSAKVQRAESVSDEEVEKIPQSAPRSLRKRKAAEATPSRKSKRHSRV